MADEFGITRAWPKRGGAPHVMRGGKRETGKPGTGRGQKEMRLERLLHEYKTTGSKSIVKMIITKLFLPTPLYSGSKRTNQRPAFLPLLQADRKAPMNVEYFISVSNIESG